MLAVKKPQVVLPTLAPPSGNGRTVRPDAALTGGAAGNQTAARLRKSFLRRAKQSANYLEKQLQKLDDASEA